MAGGKQVVIATVHLHTPAGEHLLSVQGHDFDSFIMLSVRDHSVYLTRDQARMAGEALRLLS